MTLSIKALSQVPFFLSLLSNRIAANISQLVKDCQSHPFIFFPSFMMNPLSFQILPSPSLFHLSLFHPATNSLHQDKILNILDIAAVIVDSHNETIAIICTQYQCHYYKEVGKFGCHLKCHSTFFKVKLSKYFFFKFESSSKKPVDILCYSLPSCFTTCP